MKACATGTGKALHRAACAVCTPACSAPVVADHSWGDALADMRRVTPDLRTVNLENAITQGGTPWPCKGIHDRMHPANVDCLQAAQLDACSLANSHVLDWGYAGRVDMPAQPGRLSDGEVAGCSLIAAVRMGCQQPGSS